MFKKNVMLNFELIYKFSGRIFGALFDVGNQKKAQINKIWIIFNPIRKFITVAYKVSHFEMIRLYLNIEGLLHFSFFLFNSLNTHPNSNHISSSVGVKDGLRFSYGP